MASSTDKMTQEKSSVAFYSIIAAVFMIAGKGTVGIMTGSLAILTDALHSLLDMGASIITFFAVRISDKPADRDHHFGHGKVESLAALTEMLILLVTCGWISYEAVGRLSGHDAPMKFSIWAIIVIVASITIDIARVRALRRVARKYHSQALEADALNFSTDIYSSLVVLFGIGAAYLGFTWADPVAAIGVVLFIISASLRLGKRAIDVLLDRAPKEIGTKIRRLVTAEPEVIGVNSLRLRSDGRTTFVDLDLDVDRSLSFARASRLKDGFSRDIKALGPSIDVTLTFTPVSPDSEATADTIRFVASSFGHDIHHLIIDREDDGYYVTMHVEMPGDMTLDQAHDEASRITGTLHEKIPDLHKVVIHTEPNPPEYNGAAGGVPRPQEISERVKAIIESFPGVEDCHNIQLTLRDNGLGLSADMRLDGSLPLDASHDVSHDVEVKLRAEIPELVSVTLHLEPLKN